MKHCRFSIDDNICLFRDFAEKLHIAMGYLTEQGYTPAFFEEILDK